MEEKRVEKLKIVTRCYLTEYGHEYILCKDEENRYWGIRREYVDSIGHFKVELNGITGNMEYTLPECMERCRIDSEFRYMQENGLSLDEIVERMIDNRNRRR